MLSKNVFKYIQSLKLKKHRDEEGRFVAEGPKLISELLTASAFRPVTVYGLPQFIDQQAHQYQDVEWVSVNDQELARLSLQQAPQQALAVAPIIYHPFEAFPDSKWSILLDGIQDPGNLGTIIRIADWFGIDSIFATEDAADCYNPKVVQASMGSLFRVKLHYGDCAAWLKNTSVPLYGTSMEGQSIWQAGPLDPGVIIIGNEGKGMRADIRESVSRSLSIPRIGKAESLNAGVAAGIILSHVVKH